MKRGIRLTIVLLLLGFGMATYAEKLYYKHPDLRLKFTIDTNTKEATLGTGLDQNELNAIDYPPTGDPWWDESPKTNYWKDLVIPSTIICEGTAYSSTSNAVPIERATYTVTAVASYAFYRSQHIQTIQLPETIREIGDNAFAYCIYLRTINIPDQVDAIYNGTFIWCKNLKTIHLPESVRHIWRYAFSDCIALEEINIPGNCIFIKEEAFKNCSSLSKLIIEDGTQPLQVAYCYELGLDYVGTMPKYYRGMFSDCPLKILHIGRDIEFYSDYINKYYPPFMDYYYKGVGTDGKDIFIKDGKRYREVTIGDNVTVIPESMFQYATIPNAITMPSHLVSIGDEAFSNRTGSEGTLHQSQIVFPATLESIGKNAFTNCTGLGTVICEGTTPPTLPDELYYHAFWNCNPLFIVPTGCRNIYLSDDNWCKHKIVELSDEVVTINVKTPGTLLDRLLAQDYQLGNIARLKLKGTLNDDDWANVKKMTVLYDLDISELNLDVIDENQFANSALIYIKLPNSITKISDNAFYQCRSLTGIIEIPTLCTEIGKQAFRETGITGLLYENALHISEFAFSNCLNLEEVYIKGEGTVVDRHGFGSCGLKKMTIGKGVTLGENAVPLCDNLKEVVLEDGVKYLGDWSFSSSAYIEKVYFEGDVEKLGESVFRNENIKEIHIGDIGKWCQLPFNLSSNGSPSHPLFNSDPSATVATLYYNDEELENIEIPEGVESIGEYSFYKCKSLKTVKLPNSLKNINNRVFSNCSSLEEINFPSGLESIGSYAFCLCQSLSDIDIPNTVNSISSNAFYNNKLEKIVVHWKEPINISSDVFYGVPYNCYLYIPIGTATKYSNAGWSCIPNIKAKGILAINMNFGGSVKCLGAEVVDKKEELLFNPYQSFDIEIMPAEGYYLMRAKLNGVDVLPDLVEGKISIEEAEDDYDLVVVFAKNGIVLGDVNGDGIVNQTDATIAADYLLKKNPVSFYDYATDINDDGVINITDIILLIKEFKGE